MKESKRVSSRSPMVWELGGESVVHGEVQPDPPEAGAVTTVRLTHSNSYGPVDDVTFFARLAEREAPPSGLDSTGDWVALELVEEIVWLNGEEHHRAAVADRLDPREETVWAGTFEAPLVIPTGDHRIELKVMSKGHLRSGVISDWRISVP